MKRSSFLIAASVLLTFAGTAHAQIAWGPIQAITTDSDIATNGVYFDGINSYQNNGGGGDYVTTTVGTTTFNALIGGTDGTITLSSDGGNYSNFGYAGGSTNYNYVLNQASDANNGVITLGSVAHPLTIGDIYQVQAWDSYPGPYSAHIDGNPAVNFPGYAYDYSIGTFTATSTAFTFDYSGIADNSGHAGFVSDVVVRDLGAAPEPSTYAMMFAGLAVLAFCVRRKLA